MCVIIWLLDENIIYRKYISRRLSFYDDGNNEGWRARWLSGELMLEPSDGLFRPPPHFQNVPGSEVVHSSIICKGRQLVLVVVELFSISNNDNDEAMGQNVDDDPDSDDWRRQIQSY